MLPRIPEAWAFKVYAAAWCEDKASTLLTHALKSIQHMVQGIFASPKSPYSRVPSHYHKVVALVDMVLQHGEHVAL